MSKFVVKKEQVYDDYTLLTYYAKNRKKSVKTIIPFIDSEDGYLKRLNILTGEVSLYTRNIINKSKFASLTRSRIKLYQLLEMNEFDWFLTLTFSDDVVDRFNDELVYNEYKNFVKRLEYVEPDVIYITVVERHKKGGIHYHMLIGNMDYRRLELTNSGKVCCHWATRTNYIIDKARYEKQSKEDGRILKATDGIPVFNVGIFHSGYSTATLIQDKARTNFYVLKYIEKGLASSVGKNKKRFYYSRNLELPKEKYTLFMSNYNQLEAGYRMENVNDILSLVKKYDSYYISNATYVKNTKEIDIVQVKIDNFTKKMLDSGYIPIDDDELDFGDNQVRMNLKE